MKNLYSSIFIVALSFLNLTVNAQVLEEESGEFLSKEGYLDDLEIIIKPKCCTEETVANLTFFYNPTSALTNHDRVELARERALNAWFNEQYENFKKEIEKQLNKTYPNFEQARNDYYKHVEKNNILSNAGGVKNKYDSRINVRNGTKEKSVRNLKLLELRELELNIGNINNTSYGAFNFNGTPIGNITSLSQLNTLRNQEISAFSNNERWLHKDRGVEQFLSLDIINGMGHYTNVNNYDFDILDQLLPLQINHFNSFGSWQQLDLMQLYLNNVRIPLVMIVEINAADFGTASFLETYAWNHRRGGISIWDDDYEAYLVEQMLHPNETDERAIDAAEYAAELAVEYERQAYLDNLLESISEVDLMIPPDCASFDYEETLTDWYEAAVQNIRFEVYLISPEGIKKQFTISFPEPILFGMPANLTNGGNISKGAAAEATANALYQIMREIALEYYNTSAFEYEVTQEFRTRLTEQFPVYIPGGRVVFNATNYTVAPTEYVTTGFWGGTGNCD